MRFGEIRPETQNVLQILPGVFDLSGSQKKASPLEQCVGILGIRLQSRGHQMLRSLILTQRHIRGEKPASGRAIVRIIFGELFQLGQGSFPLAVVIKEQGVVWLVLSAR